ncbi:Uncharacterised protein [Mycobacteroides abscessus subsp. abscessus]|nr:Uncharacterised protein [Mycobacteroides abscessus subsp. abscessus]
MTMLLAVGWSSDGYRVGLEPRAGRAHRIEQMCLAPRTDSRNRQTASAREIDRSSAIAHTSAVHRR